LYCCDTCLIDIKDRSLLKITVGQYKLGVMFHSFQLRRRVL